MPALFLLAACLSPGPASAESARLARGDTAVDVTVPPVGVLDSGVSDPACALPGFERVRHLPVWSEVVSCDDARVVLAPYAQTVAVRVAISRPSDGPPSPGWSTTWDLAIPTDGLQLAVERGRNLLAGSCQGWLYPGIEAAAEQTLVPVAGTVTFRVTGVRAGAYTADLSWTDLVVAGDGGDCALPDRPPLAVELSWSAP